MRRKTMIEGPRVLPSTTEDGWYFKLGGEGYL